MTELVEEHFIATCTSDAERLLQQEIANMNVAGSQAAVQNLLSYLHNNIPETDHERNMHTTFVNFLERSQCPEGKNSCLNLHIHTIVYLLNSKQLLIGNTSNALESFTSPSECPLEIPESSALPIAGEADEFLREMKELGL
jgi:hypothetical protein